MSRADLRGAALALLLLLLAAALPSDAAAHQRLLRSEPARDETAGVAPRELRLTFNEPVELTFTRVELVGPDGAPVALGEPRLDPGSSRVLVIPVEGPLRAGGYTVRWSTASRDGHPVRAEYGFAIADGAEGLAAEPPPPDPGAAATEPVIPPAEHQPAAAPGGAEFTSESAGYVAVRWVTYVGLLGVIGAAAFALLVLGRMRRAGVPDERELIGGARARAAGVGLLFVGVLAVAAVARLYAQSLAMHGTDGALDAERIGVILMRTVWGAGWLLQVVATVLAGVGFALARRGSGAGWTLTALAVLALALTPALSGHAAAMTGALGALAVATDALHVLAAGGWLGTLLVLLVAGIPAAMGLGPARRGAAVASMVRSFSPTALLFAGLLVLTGIFATVVHSGSLTALLDSRYGALLGIKLGIFLLVFGTGAYNYLRVQPALGDDTATARLRRSAGFELGVGAMVLLVTAALVATARPYEEGSASDPAAAEQPTAVAGAE